jgi:hypothetical protein
MGNDLTVDSFDDKIEAVQESLETYNGLLA